MQLVEARVRLESGAAQDSDRVRLLEQSEMRLRAAFDELAGHTLRSNSELFLRLAREALGRDQMVAEGALKEREVAIAHLVEPLRAALERTEAQVQSLERERREAFATLRTQIETRRHRPGAAAARDAQPGDGTAPPRGARPLGRADAAEAGRARRARRRTATSPSSCTWSARTARCGRTWWCTCPRRATW